MKNERIVTLKKIHERIREVVKWVDDFWIGKCPACGGLVICDSEIREHNFIRIAFTCEACRYCAEITLIVKEPRVERGNSRVRGFAKEAFKRDYLRQGKSLVRVA